MTVTSSPGGAYLVVDPFTKHIFVGGFDRLRVPVTDAAGVARKHITINEPDNESAFHGSTFGCKARLAYWLMW